MMTARKIYNLTLSELRLAIRNPERLTRLFALPLLIGLAFNLPNRYSPRVFFVYGLVLALVLAALFLTYETSVVTMVRRRTARMSVADWILHVSWFTAIIVILGMQALVYVAVTKMMSPQYPVPVVHTVASVLFFACLTSAFRISSWYRRRYI